MAGIEASWSSGIGSEPPPPYTPDLYRGFCWYKGQRHSVMDFEEAGTEKRFETVTRGEYTFHVHGVYDGEISQAFAGKTIVINDGDDGTPSGGNPPPEGNPDVAAPDLLTLTEAA